MLFVFNLNALQWNWIDLEEKSMRQKTKLNRKIFLRHLKKVVKKIISIFSTVRKGRLDHLGLTLYLLS